MIDANSLKQLVSQSETHRRIVGDYDGSYSLGVQESPPAFVLRVEPGDVSAFPTAIKINGMDVPVLVKGGFGKVVPLRAATAT